MESPFSGGVMSPWLAYGWLAVVYAVLATRWAVLGRLPEMQHRPLEQRMDWAVWLSLANGLALLYRGEVGPYATSGLFRGFNGWCWVVVIANGSCGLAVSFLLRYADSIAKT